MGKGGLRRSLGDLWHLLTLEGSGWSAQSWRKEVRGTAVPATQPSSSPAASSSTACLPVKMTLFGRQQDAFKISWALLGGGLLSTALSQGCAMFTRATPWQACLLES